VFAGRNLHPSCPRGACLDGPARSPDLAAAARVGRRDPVPGARRGPGEGVRPARQGAKGRDIRMEEIIRQLLVNLGEDPEREGLLRTPARVARAWAETTAGYAQDPGAMVRAALFEAESKEMVVVGGIDFYSTCEHHLLPFFGKAYVAYIPRGRIVGLSKMARVVEAYARRLQVQERMTSQIAQCLMENLEPLGVAVVLRAQHLCMMTRGVQKQNSYAVTSEMLGCFKKSPKTRAEFLQLIRD
jgi:GTP cyclohydrolase I